MFAGNFAPRSWAFCQGQILSIAQNTALFSLLGTTYGGNGQTTFGLPDFRGRVAVGTGQGPGLQSIQLGEIAGEPSHTLTTGEMPAHLHQVVGSSEDATKKNPIGAVPAATGGSSYTTDANGVMGTVTPTGSSQPHNNMQPYLGMNYIICLEGIYPSRN
jgi:microcystin-dependent protein